jgi:hypothetical protein
LTDSIPGFIHELPVINWFSAIRYFCNRIILQQVSKETENLGRKKGGLLFVVVMSETR